MQLAVKQLLAAVYAVEVLMLVPVDDHAAGRNEQSPL
jgi:hypothetical protein